MERPALIESGTKYFLNETLKRCHKKNSKYFNTVLNISLLSLFLILLGTVLIYKYKTKLTPKQKEEQMKLHRINILNELRAMKYKRQQEQNILITNLPRFESDFEMLHKRYYKI